jgi:cation diffusion facilitator CzcD-associated flavoprotein CzcO
VQATDLSTGETVLDWCHILVHATGYLNKPAWPSIPGLDEYEGVKLHSADYDESVSLEGRDVLLIGGGSSAVQILPAIKPVVKSVTIFIRSPVWVLPDISVEAGEFSAEQIKEFVEHPEKVLALRRENERTMNSIFSEYSLFSACCCSELMLTALASNVSEGYNPAAAMQKPPGVRNEETPPGR